MKRALLIVGGTVGGLGAVLSITPPQLGPATSGTVSALGSGSNSLGSTPSHPQTAPPTATSASPSTATSTPTTTKTRTPKSTPKALKKSTPTSVKTKVPSATPTATGTSSTPTPTQTTPATQTPSASPTPTKTTTPASTGVSGTFTGASFDADQGGRIWGRVTVTVTLNNGAISNISAIQNPPSRSYNAFSALTPAIVGVMSVKNVMAISPSSLFSQVQGRTQASYSAQAYWQSLQSALTKAGL